MNSLPPELINEIFLLVMVAQYDRDHPSSTIAGRADTAPWSLSQVSRRWRAISLHTPHLWSFIEVSQFEDDGRKAPDRILRTALARSGERPLKIDFCVSPSKDARRLLSILLEHSSRWEEVEFDLMRPSLIPMLNTAAGKVGSLRVFATTICFWNGEPHLDPGVLTLLSHGTNAMRLERVSLPLPCHLSSPTLAHFEDTRPEPGPGAACQYLRILEECRNLVSFEICYRTEDSLSREDLAALERCERVPVVSHITRMKTSSGRITRCLVLPKLTDCVAGGFDLSLGSILAMSVRSRAPLQRLSLTDVELPVADELLRLLQSAQGLEQLHIRFEEAWHADSNDALLMLFRQMAASSSFLPSLTDLTICVFEELEEIAHFLDGSFVAAVRRRAGTESALRRVSVQIIPPRVGYSGDTRYRGELSLEDVEVLRLLNHSEHPFDIDLKIDFSDNDIRSLGRTVIPVPLPSNWWIRSG